MRLAIAPFTVLPFSADHQHLSDVMLGDIIVQFGIVCAESVAVVAIPSTALHACQVQTSKDAPKSPRVDYLLEGTVRRFRRAVCGYVAHLVDVVDETYVWANTYERPAINEFAVAAELARELAVAVTRTRKFATHSVDNDTADGFNGHAAAGASLRWTFDASAGPGTPSGR